MATKKSRNVVEYLVETVGDSIRGYGASDEKVNKRTEAEMCDAFEKYVVGVEGDEGNDYFKVGDGDLLYIYNGQFYEKSDVEVKFTSIIKRVMEALDVGIVYQKNSHRMIARECYSEMLSNERCYFKPDRRYIVFDNGVLDLQTGKLDMHNMKYKTDIILPFRYSARAVSALWDSLIASTIPDEGMRIAFQEFCGGFLVDRNEYKIEYMCLMVGSGRNGKSVVCEAITRLFGSSLVSCYSPEDLFKSGQSEYRLADINGKLANYADDVSNRDFSGGDFKRFISGAQFQGRHPYGRPFLVTKVPLMLCCVNEVPPTSDDSNGHFRRLLPILCPNQVAEKDVDMQLPQKLSTDESKQAIFNWIVAGYKKLIAVGGKIEVSDSIRELKDGIEEDSNSARRWIKEMGYIGGSGDGVWRSMKEIMQEYQEYCRDFAEKPKVSKAVGRLLGKLGFEKKRMKDTCYYLLRKEDDTDLPF